MKSARYHKYRSVLFALVVLSAGPVAALAVSGTASASPLVIKQRPIPLVVVSKSFQASGPLGIVTGPDGAQWFAESTANTIGRFDQHSNPQFEWFHIRVPDSRPFGIAVGPDGTIWFTETHANMIGRISEKNGKWKITGEFNIPTRASHALAIAPGPDGTLWFTERNANKIGRISEKNGHWKIRDFTIPTPNSRPYGITAGPDGDMWFTELVGNRIGAITVEGKFLKPFKVPTADSHPRGIASGDGSVWFTERHANQIGALTLTAKAGTMGGTFTQFKIASPKSRPEGIVVVGNVVWFTDRSGNNVGRLKIKGRHSGTIKYLQISIPSAVPFGICAGPHGSSVRFTERRGPAIGVIRIHGMSHKAEGRHHAGHRGAGALRGGKLTAQAAKEESAPIVP